MPSNFFHDYITRMFSSEPMLNGPARNNPLEESSRYETRRYRHVLRKDSHFQR
jgi:hypothetical protein